MKLNEIACFVSNVPATTAFYRALLGHEPVAESDGMAIFLVGETKLLIHEHYAPGEGELPPENHVAFAVPDVDDACARLTAEGLVLEIPPRDYYWGRSAYLRDPDGQLIEIAQTS